MKKQTEFIKMGMGYQTYHSPLSSTRAKKEKLN
jgi:hypothetical protein